MNNSIRTTNDLYDVYKLWYYTESLPIKKMSVQRIYELAFKNKSNPWSSDNDSISVQDQIAINKADISYPILLTANYTSLDGLHRIAKAKQIHRTYISYKIVPFHILRKCVTTKPYDHESSLMCVAKN